MDKLLEILLLQEKTLKFDSFKNSDAWEIGTRLVKKAVTGNLPITVDITRNRQQLFHYSCDGTSADNDEWIRRKVNVVYRFGHSSYYIGCSLKSKDATIEGKYFVSPFDYSPHGGSFPIIINDTGVIGTVTVSGLAQKDDHDLVVEVLSEYLGIETEKTDSAGK